MTKSALLIVDIQNDYFPGGLMPLPEMEAAAAKAAKLLKGARDRAEPIFHIRHIAASTDAPFFRPGTEGSCINAAVLPEAAEPVLEKSRPNSFVDTGLETMLREARITHLTICGAMSQMCIDATARAAVDLGFHVTVVSDACAAASVTFAGITVPHDHVHASIMAPLAASYAQVVDLDHITKERDRQSA
ncbi:cysteine hydrolase family protein [Sedimentitalea nanhaiensis]|uniref:Nicotinamidase-related amidase n=1 Tax=Sedimentitalea nanhaiensis TaxID=999627 RepID=A0A1I7D5R5_9RHOB|nr:cysteine hydrolase family protein [Sedimentitalea nanhaiensis]SFU06971.1 Nicotinamidase-related amidase [Sedimentitalea nanhaiensis]